MDQIKVGKFISTNRKLKHMTQRELADILGISDKTISKWETGNGLPEVSLMLPLCEALDISVNELLSGEKLSIINYQEKAEDNMLSLLKKNEANRKRLFQTNYYRISFFDHDGFFFKFKYNYSNLFDQYRIDHYYFKHYLNHSDRFKNRLLRMPIMSSSIYAYHS